MPTEGKRPPFGIVDANLSVGDDGQSVVIGVTVDVAEIAAGLSKEARLALEMAASKLGGGQIRGAPEAKRGLCEVRCAVRVEPSGRTIILPLGRVVVAYMKRGYA